MTTKLFQKKFLKGRREFEIIDDTVTVRNKGLLKEERLTVGLSTLDPKPVVNGAELEFYSRYQGRMLLALYINKPNKEEFNAFVDSLRQHISGEINDVGGINMSDLPEGMEHNVFEEPPEFAALEKTPQDLAMPSINTDRLEEDISMLKNYLDEDELKPFFKALESLKAEPLSKDAFHKVVDTFNDLGLNQGAVLTYGTYLKVLLSNTLATNDPFANH